MTEDEHRCDILRRLEIPPLHRAGTPGYGVSAVIIDSGMLPDSELGNLVEEDIDFTGSKAARHKRAYHGETVADCFHLIAPSARIGNFRVVNDAGRIKREWAIAALQHCIDVFPKYRVANLSLSFQPAGCPDSCELCAKVTQAYHHGIYVVAAAGNTGPEPATPTCPALAHWVVASQATWSKAEAEYWETHKWHRLWVTHFTGDFAKSYGTSYSAAYASGAAALHLSAFPRLPAYILRHAVISVMREMNAEGLVTISHNRVREFLKGLRRMAKQRYLVELPGASRTFLEEF